MKASSPRIPTPIRHRAIGGHQHGASLVAAADELEEQVSRIGLERQMTELIDCWAVRIFRIELTRVVLPTPVHNAEPPPLPYRAASHSRILRGQLP